jgi:hypothetical protein
MNSRTRKRHQYGPEFKDVAVGKIDLKNTPYLQFQKKKPYEWNKLTSPCYNKHHDNCSSGTINSPSKLVNTNLFQFNERELTLKNRNQHSRIPYLGEESEYHKYANIDLYNNCFEVEGICEKGNSGAPILNEKGLVVGIFSGGGLLSNKNDEKKFPINIHSSRYVQKKARKMKKAIQKELSK